LAESKLASAVVALERALAGAGRHMVIGGVAVIARGVRRLTDDVDVTLWAAGVDLAALVARLGKCGLVPRIPAALTFAKRNQVLLLVHESSGVEVDLSLAWLPFESDALDRAELVTIGRRRVPVAIADDLIVYKAIAARERDRSDIERLLEIHGRTIDIAHVRRTVEELAAALERPELAEDLERIIRAARPRAARKTVRRKTRAPRRAQGR
jgi:hypothetical protein